MISFKFPVGGQIVEAQTDNFEDAVKVLSAVSKATDPRLASLEKARAVRMANAAERNASGKSYRSTKGPRSWQRWTMEEVRALYDNRHLSTKELVKVPLLAGRSRNTLRSMRACVKNTNRTDAPTNIRKYMDIISAESSTLA